MGKRFERWLEAIVDIDARFQPLLNSGQSVERDDFYTQFFARGMTPAGALRVYTYMYGDR